jgi:hypothetical protein
MGPPAPLSSYFSEDEIVKITGLRPSKPVSAGSLIGLTFMLLFGIVFLALVLNALSENEAPPLMFALVVIFMLAWIGTVLFMLIYHALNLKRAKGLSLVDVDSEPSTPGDKHQNDAMQRLRSLEELKRDGLITEDEFMKKREEMMQEKW